MNTDSLLRIELAQRLDECFDILIFGCPTGTDAHGGVGIVDFLPIGELEMFADFFQPGVGQDGEELVGVGFYEEGYSAGDEGSLDLHGALDSVC